MKTSEAINIGSKILKNRNITSHKIDAEIILSHVLKTSREKLLINEQAISYINLKRFKKIISRRSKKEPIAYIFNKKEFRSKDFYVVKNSLIPRPETELLIDPIIKKFKGKSIYFLDMGVGTGCIMLSILSELNNSRGLGIDICNKAISVAKINLETMKLNKRASLKCRSIDTIYNKKFDLIVSNPPYIVKREINQLSEDIKKFEPQKALDGGHDGLDVIRKVIYKSKNILKLNGILALEIGRGQYYSVYNILRLNGFREIKKIKDYRDNVRCIFSTLK
tara:strand:+ start:251 stop:1087 length:837 start_codon:yes stop_codon:yes gene_type:complete